MFLLAAFVHPLPVGQHTITLAGTVDGPYPSTIYGSGTSVSYNITYDVDVTRGP